MPIIVGVDPGPKETAWVVLGNDGPVMFEKAHNEAVLTFLSGLSGLMPICIEMIASYGMPVGREVFETCVWIGRYMQVQPTATRITRGHVKMNICKSPKANDASIRTALLDLYGGKEKAIGNKKSPGPLYGMSGDVWAALAVAHTARDVTERFKP